MNTQDVVALVSSAGVGFGAGWVVGGPVPALAFAALGLVFAVGANRFRVRAVISIPVFTGAMVGAVLGRGIVSVLCLPGSCVPLEIAAAVLLAAGAVVGVGIVAALVVRSFDEYRAAVDANRPPPEPGCEADEQD